MTRDELLRVLDGDSEGEAYHGPATKTNLKGVTAEMAAQRPIADAHTIAELVNHLVFGREWVLNAVAGKKPDDNWWPPLTASWDELLRKIDTTRDRLVAVLPELEKKPEVYRFLIHHELYHSGQIGLLRKSC